MGSRPMDWIRDTLYKILAKIDRKSADINLGMSGKMWEALVTWDNLYRNEPLWKSTTVHPLNTPATIAGKFAKMVTLEMECNISGSPRADYIAEQMSPLLHDIREKVERACAMGGMAFKPYISGDRIAIDSVPYGNFFPTSYNSNHELVGGMFVARKTIGSIWYTRIESHEFYGNEHRIRNYAYRSSVETSIGSPCPLQEVAEWADIQPDSRIVNVERPLFAHFKIPIANNIDPECPLGVSVFSKAVKTIKDLDEQYSRLIWEFKGGELAISATDDYFLHNSNGQIFLDDHEKRLYRVLETPTDNSNLFEVFSPAFRDTSLLNGFNAILRQIETQCGMSFGTLSNVQNVERTATETIHAKQEMYTTVNDIQKSLQTALENLIYAIDVLTTIGNLAPSGNVETSFYWDDSIIVDKDVKRQQFWQYVSAGKFPFWKFLVDFEGYTEEEAKALAAEANSSMPRMFGDVNATS